LPLSKKTSFFYRCETAVKNKQKMKNKLACRWAFFYGAKISNESKLLLIILAMATNKKNK